MMEKDRQEFQSPERIHAFGNPYMCNDSHIGQFRFNPQRGFMLLGTFKEEQKCQDFIVSIPREDSCFWELARGIDRRKNPSFQSPERIHAFGNFITMIPGTGLKCFNPQRGFMLLGTLLQRQVVGLKRGVSIPREDSCFWEPKAT